MTPPKHLWSGDWRHESDLARQEAERTERMETPERPAEPGAMPPPPPPPPATRVHRATPPPPPPAPEGERKSRRGLIAAGIVVGVLAIGGGAYAIGTAGDGDPGTSTTANTALPAITGAPIPQKTGQTRAAAIYAKASPAVVSIRTGTGSGTGFLIDKNGTIVTNAHVVQGSKQVQIKFGVHSATLKGTVMGTDPSADLAVVDLQDSDVPNVTPLSLADSRTVKVGDDVIAIGNPFGLDRTETTGIVSGIARDIPAPNGFQISEAIQTDASINPGNSGGPLLNAAGVVIGVNSQIETAGSSGSVGVGFAVPSNLVRQVVPGLAKGETIAHAWLGVQVGEVTSGSGALVGGITAGGPAASSGLRQGDVVESIDGTPTPDASSLTSTINGKQAGAKVELKVRRGSDTVDVTVTLGTRPATAAKTTP